jgi:acyl carrier protein
VPDKQEIFNAIRDRLADSLALRPDEITMESRLIEDLGADSLDFVDIIFSLERQFSIKLKSAEVDSLLRADFDGQRLVEKSFIRREDVDRLIEWLPAMSEAPDLDRITPFDLFRYITTESLVLLVERRILAATDAVRVEAKPPNSDAGI